MEKKDIYNSIILVNSNDVSKVRIAHGIFEAVAIFRKASQEITFFTIQ